MKKLILATAPVAMLAAAYAVPATAADAHLSGFISEVCEVSFGTTDLYLGTDFGAGDGGNVSVSFECNDADGADVELRSSEGGLESDDNEDFEVEYTATLTGPGGLNLVLDTGLTTNVNDISVSGSIGSVSPAVAGNLNITIDDNAPWAGGYSDTISVEITAQ